MCVSYQPICPAEETPPPGFPSLVVLCPMVHGPRSIPTILRTYEYDPAAADRQTDQTYRLSLGLREAVCKHEVQLHANRPCHVCPPHQHPEYCPNKVGQINAHRRSNKCRQHRYQQGNPPGASHPRGEDGSGINRRLVSASGRLDELAYA
ncbi:uncharacterized protein LY79DRAFT_415081 [Colletotrichum navitas]|uniref:Uncharacterized protein n=1 Tax=Colletotrichum navitas TaxID=681940 RepID=A0AAD8PNE7_9PEZI|nr:uncharacterized protein LY79DRAFT_415081 [Colletotrichum navitas]KAK1573227.1 hypothetical protein LY79DRAFT_415081 [Colletotrichum navitas]